MILPFRCPYCEQSFCPEHRLPENHSCPEHWRARAPGPQPPPIVPQEKRYEYSVSYTPRLGTTFQFSHKELEHLAIGALLVTGVGLSFIPQAVGMPPLTNLEILVPLIVIFTLSFLIHEIAHKFTAQYYGLWAEFRIVLWGAILTLISILPIPFKVISPGAVMMVGSIGKKEAGKTALAGPLTNIVISSLCTSVLVVSENPSLWTIFSVGATINAMIAIFNLIPFGIMDGLKVFRWNKLIWAAAFGASVALTIYTFTL